MIEGCSIHAGVIFDIKRFAIHDGPGIRTTVFLKGCPLSCWWCHNPESRSPSCDILHRPNLCVRCGTCVVTCPETARSLKADSVERDIARCELCGACVNACPSGALERIGRSVTADEVMAAIERDMPFFDESGGGVTFSGGEPLGQPGFLEEMLRRCREHSIHTTVDTCGFSEPAVLRSVAARTDLFLFDLKQMDRSRHRELTGVDNDLILENLEMLAAMGTVIRIRIPVIPAVTDTRSNLDAIGKFLSSLEPHPPVTLLPHHATAMEKYPRFGVDRRLPDGVAPPSRETLGRLASHLTGHGLDVSY